MSSNQPDEALAPDLDASIAFLRRLPGRVHLVAISPDGGGIEGKLFSPTRADGTRKEPRERAEEIRSWIDQRNRSKNVYFTCNVVAPDFKGPKPTDDDIAELRMLKVDLDPLPVPADWSGTAEEWIDRERAQILASLTTDLPEGVGARPTIVLDSGQGLWGLWLSPVSGDAEAGGLFRDCGEKLIELYRAKLGKQRVDGVADLSRIARLPGTLNHPGERKRKKGRRLSLARVVEEASDDTRRRDPIAFLTLEEQAARLEARKPSKRRARGRGSKSSTTIGTLDDLAVDDDCKVVIAQGCDPDDDPGRFGGAPSLFGLPCGAAWQGDRSKAVWYVACELVRAGADDDTIRALLLDEGWGISAHVLDQKDPERSADRQIERARDEVGEVEASAGERGGGKGPVLDPFNPGPSARTYVEREAPHLLFYNGDWLDYGRGAYVEVEPGIVSARVFSFLERSRRREESKPGKYEVGPFKPMRKHVGEVLSALEAVTIRARDLYAPPCWIAEPGPPPREIISCANGLLHLPTGELHSATPRFFTRNALEIAYDPAAPPPTAWLAFLGQLWPKDPDCIGVLQEVFGYLLVPDTSQQKVFLLVGPARSGKGTIGRVLTRLVGEANVVGSDMRTLGGNFGLQPLIGKQLAIVADMRLGKRSDPATIAENLLRISGEDLVTADRKNKTAWTGTLAVRFVIMTNELPRFSDASGALANRFVPLVMTETFLGREDHGLTARLLGELPGILNWAVDGWRRLRGRGHFVLPGSSRDAVQDLLDMASPVSAFVRDVCVLDPEARAEKGQLYAAWREWCLARGEPIAEEAVFSRDLYAATAGCVRAGKMPRPERAPAYVGIRLGDAAESRDEPDHEALG
jgi:P4 family phage/plasmid primase-like protien